MARRVLPFLVAAIVLSVIAAITLTLWARSSPVRSVGAPEEMLIEFIQGQNFAKHGFLSRGFLTDGSLDPAPDAPPARLTHQPPLVSLIIGVLISAGLDDLPKVRLVMTLVFIAGLIAVMAFFWRHLSPWHGIATVAFLGLNARSVLNYSDHVVYAYWFGLTFLALWTVSYRKEGSPFLWLAAAAVFLISWINYIQLVIFLVTLAGLWLVRAPNFTSRRVLLLSAVAMGGVALHIIQNIIVLGPQVALLDIFYAVGNRIFAYPGREAIRAFAWQNSLVVFGIEALEPVGSRFSWIWKEFFYFGIPILLSLAGLAALALRHRLPSLSLASFPRLSFSPTSPGGSPPPASLHGIPSPQGYSSLSLSLRLLAVFAAASLSFHLIFQAAGQAYPMTLFLSLPIAMVVGLFVGELLAALRSRLRPVWLTLLLLILASGAIGLTARLGLRGLDPERPAPHVAELAILKDFQGEGFWTNITPHLVGYYTRSWVVGQMPLEGMIQKDVTKAYVIPVSRLSPTWEQVNSPRYFFFSQHNVVLNLPDRGPRLELYRRHLEENYRPVAWSPYGSMVFDLSQPTDPAKRVRGSQQLDLSEYESITLSEGQLSVSSSLDPTMGKSALIRPGTESFWHLENPRRDPEAWVAIDLGEKRPISLLRLRPRAGLTSQMWDGYAARLQVSDNGVDWADVVALGLDRAQLRDDWIYFPLPSSQEGRYFRLIVWDMSFMSLGRLELYAPGGALLPQALIVDGVPQFDLSGYGKIILTENQLSVSNSLSPTMGKGALIRPGTDGFWHLENPRRDPEAWVAIDLGEKLPVSLLRLRPRAGLASQMWDGYAARLQVSDNGVDWADVATLGIERARLQDDWIYFPLPSPQKRRYFRLIVRDMSFLSLGRLELYTPQR